MKQTAKIYLFIIIAVVLVITLLLTVKGRLVLPLSESSESLVLIHVIFRHGKRTQLKEVLYHGDPHINQTYYPYGYGELTNDGKRMVYKLGYDLRRKYGSFLGELYQPEFVDAYSSTLNRAKNSMQLVLANLYPPKGLQKWYPFLNWQPIPFNIVSTEDKILSDHRKYCPRWEQIYNKTLAIKEVNATTELYRSYYDYLANHTGWKSDPMYANYIYNSIISQLDFDLKLPDWIKSIYPDPTIKLNVYFWNLWTFTDEAKMVTGGYLFTKIINDTWTKINKKTETKIHLYSGHDYNIVFFLRILGFPIKEHPPYASSVVMEVHKIKDEYFVRFIYRKGRTVQILHIPNCDVMCPLETFLATRKKYFPSNDICKN